MSMREMPKPIDHLFRMECPVCGRKWMRSFAMRMTGYPMHYASAHLGIRVWR